MSLPVWDSDTLLKYKGRWNALQRVGRRIENESTTNDTSRILLSNNAFPEPADVSPPFKSIKVRDPDGQLVASFFRLADQYVQAGIVETNSSEILSSDHQPLNYDTLYEGLAHLLYTQPDNPPYESLILHLDGEDNRRACYKEISIPKKRGGQRTLTVPHHPLKWLQRSLLTVLTHLFPRHKCAHGFERGKSIVTHAKQHTNKKYVYTIDIKDFFPSITRNRVFGMLQAYPINATTPVARYLANLTCHDGCLPQGAPTSPILSNLLCRRLDSRLFKWSRQNGYTYSRYADDLTFSTNRDSFPESDIAFIDDIIRDEGFEVNDEKRRLQPYYERQMVTGLVVNEKVNLPREKLRGLRALLRNIEEHGWLSQVHRTSIFDNAEEWRSYISADLSRTEFRKLERQQREKNQLLNPSATLPRVEDEDDLREVVRGKVEFVGAVRGKDDDIYQRMLDKMNELVGQYEAFQGKQKEGTEYSEHRREEDEELLSRLGRVEQETSQYGQLFTWLRDDDVSTSELREKLGQWRSDSLEIGWLLDRTLHEDEEEWIGEAKKIAHALDTSPAETALFFRRFNDDKGFRGLLHDPATISEAPEAILGACRKAFEEYRLPNGLKNATQTLLKKCTKCMESNNGAHPWHEKKELLQAYKKKTRFKVKPGEDLIGRLKSSVSRIENEFATEIRFHSETGRGFRTHVPSILPPIRQLIRSMAEHTVTDAVHVDVDWSGMDPFPEVVMEIWDEGGRVYGPPHLDNLFSGDTRRALYNQTNDHGLRGYARWTFIAPFANDGSYEFDVMDNQRCEVEREVPGVTHRITFYK